VDRVFVVIFVFFCLLAEATLRLSYFAFLFIKKRLKTKGVFAFLFLEKETLAKKKDLPLFPKRGKPPKGASTTTKLDLNGFGRRRQSRLSDVQMGMRKVCKLPCDPDAFPNATEKLCLMSFGQPPCQTAKPAVRVLDLFPFCFYKAKPTSRPCAERAQARREASSF